jgi:heme oxygenase (mycobilin-producing)
VAFIALSRFVVANDQFDDVRAAFLARPCHVDQADGFVRMEVLQPTNAPAEFWLMTWWREEADFDRWYRSHSFAESHEGIPAGLKLVPGSTRLTRLERISD